MDTTRVPTLLDALAVGLELPRELPAQVVSHLVGTYGVARETVGVFLVDELPKLEDYEIDLILSPVFTPALSDQATFAELLGTESVPPVGWPAIVQQLASRPVQARLITEDGREHIVPLREVTIERYVHRLRLDATIPDSLFKLINHLAPAADRPMLKAVARRAVWETDARHQILVRYLTTAIEGDEYRLADAVELLRVAEIYQPADLYDLLRHIPHWQRVLRQEINSAASPKPFFNERVQELHGGGRDQRRQDDSRITAKEKEQAFLERLERVLTES